MATLRSVIFLGLFACGGSAPVTPHVDGIVIGPDVPREGETWTVESSTHDELVAKPRGAEQTLTWKFDYSSIVKHRVVAVQNGKVAKLAMEIVKSESTETSPLAPAPRVVQDPGSGQKYVVTVDVAKQEAKVEREDGSPIESKGERITVVRSSGVNARGDVFYGRMAEIPARPVRVGEEFVVEGSGDTSGLYRIGAARGDEVEIESLIGKRGEPGRSQRGRWRVRARDGRTLEVAFEMNGSGPPAGGEENIDIERHTATSTVVIRWDGQSR